MGVSWRWLPGGSFAREKVWEEVDRECKRMKMSCALFAGDTTIAGMSKEIDEGVKAVKSVMDKLQGRSDDAKEDGIEFGTSGVGNVRVLGS